MICYVIEIEFSLKDDILYLLTSAYCLLVFKKIMRKMYELSSDQSPLEAAREFREC